MGPYIRVLGFYKVDWFPRRHQGRRVQGLGLKVCDAGLYGLGTVNHMKKKMEHAGPGGA